MAIQFKRGTQAQVDAESTVLLRGQPLFATDTGELTIGTENGQPAQLGKKYVPLEVTKKQKEYQLAITDDSTWTNPIAGVTSPSTSGFVFPTSLASSNYTDIRTERPSWDDTSTSSGKYYIVVKVPSDIYRQSFGGGYNFLRVEFTVSGQNKAITYFVFSTYSTALPEGSCYLILSAGSGGINTTNTSTPTVINCNVVGISTGDTYLDRPAGYIYYDGTKMQAQENLNLTYLRVSGNNALSLYSDGNYIHFNPRASSNNLRISTSGVTDYTWDFPQQSGSLALLSDIPSVNPEHNVMMSDQVTLNSSNMGQGSITINTATKGLSNAEITGFIVQVGTGSAAMIYQYKLEDIYRVEATMGGSIRSLGKIFNNYIEVIVESLTQSYGSNTFNYTTSFKFSANSYGYGAVISVGFTYKGMAFANSGAY